ncbi:MAG TPA: UMP kinase [bacterium]|nr:UMP kinase [bacterium]
MAAKRAAVKGGRKPRFKRILLKISGEALAKGGSAHDADILESVCGEVAGLVKAGCQVGMVVGGGNIFRGLTGVKGGFERTTGDHMGMLATVINALALRATFERLGTRCEVMTAFPIIGVTLNFNKREAVRLLESDVVVVFAADTGNPYFTTDTGAALRAIEIEADIMMKATKVDGVYTADPKKDPTAKRYDRISYAEVIAKQLGVMDITAITLCRENKLPVMVFAMTEPGSIAGAVAGTSVGTIVEE